MKIPLAPLVMTLLLVAGSARAEMTPEPDQGDPRIQTIVYRPAERFNLTAAPHSALTIMFLPNERIKRVETSDQSTFAVSVTPSADSINLLPKTEDGTTVLSVETIRHRYTFDITTKDDPSAAFLVRFLPSRLLSGSATNTDQAEFTVPDTYTGTYRLSGDRALRPVAIGDDGQKTYMEWGEYQFLPAVFGIGPTGDEEVVDGHVRGGLFVIDRVYPELVFRIDKDRAIAKREQELAGYDR